MHLLLVEGHLLGWEDLHKLSQLLLLLHPDLLGILVELRLHLLLLDLGVPLEKILLAFGDHEPLEPELEDLVLGNLSRLLSRHPQAGLLLAHDC